ncbi:MAG TPA: LLM class flavin-dependent oxidoreductase [Methylomirabilota bacterium]|jgi:alkanesulfonate monooxygenase SsuD/methylene tetrahydromethanopterin reductase-like flavin-dependent oxidoreductase (luciferase family)|nr:LLM class flavin-dependent oxidoreductase [Methylomirabilota bacterium]
MSRLRIGVSVMPLENRREALVDLATAADRRGYDAFMLPETWAYDVTVLLAEAAVKTRRITLGTCILGVWNRSSATIAMAARTLASMSSGRFLLGLGASTPQLTEGLHDVPFTAPIGRMRRTVTQVRALLRGDRVPLAVAREARALRLNVPAEPEVPIYLAALGDDATRLAGELADGWMPFLYPLRLMPHGLERLREGAARGGRSERLPVICPSLPTVVAADPAKAREGAAWFVAFYLTTMGTFYRDSLIRQGFEKEVKSVLAANSPKPLGVVPPDAEELLEQLIVYGTPEEARRRLARWHAAGAGMAGLLLRPAMPADELAFTLDAFRPMLESAVATA